MKLKAIASDRPGHIVLDFGDENRLSLLFANGSHTENWQGPIDAENLLDWYNAPVSSTTLEIMPSGEISKICEEYEDYWDDSLLNYFPVENLLELLNKIGNS